MSSFPLDRSTRDPRGVRRSGDDVPVE